MLEVNILSVESLTNKNVVICGTTKTHKTTLCYELLKSVDPNVTIIVFNDNVSDIHYEHLVNKIFIHQKAPDQELFDNMATLASKFPEKKFLLVLDINNFFVHQQTDLIKLLMTMSNVKCILIVTHPLQLKPSERSKEMKTKFWEFWLSIHYGFDYVILTSQVPSPYYNQIVNASPKEFRHVMRIIFENDHGFITVELKSGNYTILNIEVGQSQDCFLCQKRENLEHSTHDRESLIMIHLG